jgi:hypothetical protein
VILTHSATTHITASVDYKDQIFDVRDSEPISELCQLSEKMILKLTSDNWHYRHGAVLCLMRSVGPSAPNDYLEDLAVHLFTLLALDRFKDFIGDTVHFPVQEPACHLLARCLMRHLPEAVRILTDFHTQPAAEDWGLRLSFWLVIAHMLTIDTLCLDVEWLEARLLESFEDSSDDVISVAISAVLPILTDLPRFGEIGGLCGDCAPSPRDGRLSPNGNASCLLQLPERSHA